MDETSEGGAAPVAEAPAPAVVTESPIDTSSEAPSSPTPTGEADAPAVKAEAPSFPSHDDFGWDAWDGEVSTLPEPVQPWAQRVYDQRSTWVDQRVSEGLSEANRIKDIYNALLDGHDDPRFGELQGTNKELQDKFDALTASSQQAEADFSRYKEDINKAIEVEASRYADWFERTYGEMFKTPEAVAKLESLLGAGWEIDFVPGLMDLDEKALAVASNALKEGVPPKYAVQLAQRAPAKAVRPKPRPAAKITSGATSAPSAPHLQRDESNQVRSLDDMRQYAAKNALKRHSGGRR